MRKSQVTYYRICVFGAVGHVVVSAGSPDRLGMKWHGSVYLVALAAGHIDNLIQLLLQYFMPCSHELADINQLITTPFSSHLFR